MTRATDGNARSFAESSGTAATDGAMTSIRFGLVSGSLMRSRYVAIDSTFGLRRCIGFESNGSLKRNGMPATVIKPTKMSTALRCSMIQ